MNLLREQHLQNIIDVWSMTTAGLASGYGRQYFNGRKPKVKVIHIGPDPPECFRRYIWGRSRKFIPKNNKLSGDDHVSLYRKTANVCSLLNVYVYVNFVDSSLNRWTMKTCLIHVRHNKNSVCSFFFFFFFLYGFVWECLSRWLSLYQCSESNHAVFEPSGGWWILNLF